MSTFETAAQVEEYMLKKMPFSDDISMKGIREENIEKAMAVLEQVMDADEHLIVYGNKGIFSKKNFSYRFFCIFAASIERGSSIEY